MNMNAEQFAFLLDFAKLIQFVENRNEGTFVTGGELYRTAEMEAIYLREGKTKTMNSNHLKRLAIDLNFIRGGQLVSDKVTLQPYGDFWESLNPINRWGGNFTTILDTDHFERNVV
jgi:hypothetical protein